VNPKDHVGFFTEVSDGPLAGQIRAIEQSVRGATTIRTLDLSSSYYLRGRKAQLHRIWHAFINLDQAQLDGDDAGLTNARNALTKLMSDTNEFAGLARAFARSVQLDKHYDVSIPE